MRVLRNDVETRTRSTVPAFLPVSVLPTAKARAAGRHPWTGVFHVDSQPKRAVRFPPDRDATADRALVGELDGVAQQVDQDLANLLDIAELFHCRPRVRRVDWWRSAGADAQTGCGLGGAAAISWSVPTSCGVQLAVEADLRLALAGVSVESTQ